MAIARVRLTADLHLVCEVLDGPFVQKVYDAPATQCENGYLNGTRIGLSKPVSELAGQILLQRRVGMVNALVYFGLVASQ